MAFETKTLEELVELEKDEYRARIPEADLSEGSDYDIEARTHAVPVFGNQAHAEYLTRQILPSTADADMLERHADRVGLAKKGASAARGRVSIGLEPTGVPPLVQPAGSEVTSAAGRTYTLDEDAVVTLPTWSGKTTRAGATLTRVQVSPNVIGMHRGDRISVAGLSVGDQERTIVRVFPSIQTIEVSPPLEEAPEAVVDIIPIASAFALASSTATGADTNQEPGEVGSLSGPTTGISAQVEFVEMTGGADEETTSDRRRNVLAVMAVRPGSGNLEQWRRRTIETPNVGVVEAFVYPNIRGLGTVTIVPFGPVGARHLGEERNAEIRAWLRQLKDFDDDVEVLGFSWAGLPQNLLLRVRPGRGYEPDVDTSGSGIDLDSTIPSTADRLQLFDGPMLDRFQVGDRVVVPVVVEGFPTTEQRTVRATLDAGAGDYQVHLLEPLSAAPALGERIYSGGPLYETIRESLDAYFDALGPGDTDPASRWPATVDDWPADVIRSALTCAVQDLTGVRDVVVDEPSANVITPPLFVQRLGELRIIWEE